MPYLLRELEQGDVSTINAWRNDPALIRSLGAPFRYINMDVDLKWYQDYLNSRSRCVRCAIVEKAQPEKILGLVSLTDIDMTNRAAKLHIMIGKTCDQGRGAGSFAVNAMIAHAFDNMNLRRIELNVLADNERAIHVYQQAGFVREGVRREACFKNGRYVDMWLMALLLSDRETAM